MEISQILKVAETKGFSIDRSNDAQLGIKFPKKHVWHWFDLIGDNAHFNHSYSQNTGRTNKGFRHGYSLVCSLEKLHKSINN